MKGSGDAAEEIVASLNHGDSALPIDMSKIPFVFDGEIIITGSSVSRIWNGLVSAGFVITDPLITSISPVMSDDYTLFRSNWEMDVFFRNKIPLYTYKITIEGIDGEILLLINRDNNRSYSLIGMKVDAK